MAHELTFGIVIEPQHWSWAENVEQWTIAEQIGADSIWLNDHFHSLGSSIDNDAFEASTSFAALAMATTRPKIGVLTYGNTHRLPTVLAKEMVTVDHMSGGRVIFGIGAGWNESEHAAYSIPFPSAGERVAMLDEALDLIKELERNERTTFRGRYYTLVDAPFVQKPVNGRLPILIGGTKPKMLRLIGKHADIWGSGLEIEQIEAGLRTIREHAREFGRDPEEITASTAVWRGKMTEGEFVERARALYKAGVRQMLFKQPPDRAGIDQIAELMERVVPDLRAELSR